MASERQSARQRAYYARNREAVLARLKAGHYERLYGITEAQALALLASQGGKCAMCDKQLPGLGKGAGVIDHDHKTGRVRGVLCDKCNLGLGYVEKYLARALRYLNTPTSRRETLDS